MARAREGYIFCLARRTRLGYIFPHQPMTAWAFLLSLPGASALGFFKGAMMIGSPAYDPKISLTANLQAFGYRHDVGNPNTGQRKIIDAKTGQVVEFMNCDTAAAWLKRGAPRD